MQQVANVSSDVIEPLFAQYDTSLGIEYILQRPEMNCADAVQNALTITSPKLLLYDGQ